MGTQTETRPQVTSHRVHPRETQTRTPGKRHLSENQIYTEYLQTVALSVIANIFLEM